MNPACMPVDDKALRLFLWLAYERAPFDWERVCRSLDWSRATAYRALADLRAVDLVDESGVARRGGAPPKFRREDAPERVHFGSLRQPALLPALEPAIEEDVASVDLVESGALDHLKGWARRGDIRGALIEVHAREWQVSPKLFSPQAKDLVKAVRSLENAGHTPSQVATAIRGMRRDPWEERRQRNGWTYLERHFSRWLTLATEAAAAETPRREDYPDHETWTDAMLEHARGRRARRTR